MNSLSTKQLKDLGQSQKERLFHIDFKLRFLGTFNRNDLVSRFGIKAAAATRDLSLYKNIAPKNLTYDTKAKAYIKSENFEPIFEYTGMQALSALCQGLGDDHVAVNNELIAAEMPTHLNTLNLDVLAELTKAIHQKKILQIKYCSLSSGRSTRKIVPFALVDNGLRWHVRAFDQKREQFTDFVINRISNPHIQDSYVPKNQTREADIQWNRIVDMHIVPHPNLKYPETIEREYAMTDGMLKVQVRAAIAGYLLRLWNVDCSKNHSLNGKENHLWLKNQQTLYGVDNLTIAPGYDFID
ncbi:helix-turn-helix transcriptional regulator [Shewanella algicola]|uniref:helix-turn-helix transcriptional regulator n=1 Tax=Shewanella algicola TaxID=640633 RepID=UPI002494D299|nr:WYL domain-containing protein [Shewanella algicola]